jgi:hypothetical protein
MGLQQKWKYKCSNVESKTAFVLGIREIFGAGPLYLWAMWAAA